MVIRATVSREFVLKELNEPRIAARIMIQYEPGEPWIPLGMGDWDEFEFMAICSLLKLGALKLNSGVVEPIVTFEFEDKRPKK